MCRNFPFVKIIKNKKMALGYLPTPAAKAAEATKAEATTTAAEAAEAVPCQGLVGRRYWTCSEH